MRYKKKIVIFDLDGVLINSLPNMQYALKRTSLKLNLKLKFKDYKKFIGLPFEKILLNMGVKNNHDLIKFFYIKYSNQNILKIKILKNKLKYLNQLKKKCALAIFTSKDRFRTLKILKKYKLFTYYVTSDDVKTGKPSPEGILKILKKTKYSGKDCYYVGDTLFDFKAAKSAKVNYLHAVWGIDKKLKYKNVRYVKSFFEIKKIILH